MARGSAFTRKTKRGLVWFMKVEGPRRPDGTRTPLTKKCPPHVNTETKARKAAAAWQAEIDASTLTDPSRLPFAEYMEDYLTRRERFEAIRPTTLEKYRVQQRVVAAVIGTIRVDRLGNRDMQRFIDHLNDLKRAPYTIQQYGGFLRMICLAAVASGHIARSPMQGVRLPPPKPRPQDHLNRAEVLQLLEVAKRDSYWPLWLIFLATALRIGEVLALQWQDIDLPHRQLSVRHTLHRRDKRLGPPKNDAGHRKVALPQMLAVELALHRTRQQEHAQSEPAWQNEGMVFANRFGAPLVAQTVRNHLYRLCLEAGVTKVSPHDLRRSVATILGEEGVHINAVAHLLGHGTTLETARTYTATTSTMITDATGHLEALFNQASPEE